MVDQEEKEEEKKEEQDNKNKKHRRQRHRDSTSTNSEADHKKHQRRHRRIKKQEESSADTKEQNLKHQRSSLEIHPEHQVETSSSPRSPSPANEQHDPSTEEGFGDNHNLHSFDEEFDPMNKEAYAGIIENGGQASKARKEDVQNAKENKITFDAKAENPEFHTTEEYNKKRSKDKSAPQPKQPPKKNHGIKLWNDLLSALYDIDSIVEKPTLKQRWRDFPLQDLADQTKATLFRKKCLQIKRRLFIPPVEKLLNDFYPLLMTPIRGDEEQMINSKIERFHNIHTVFSDFIYNSSILSNNKIPASTYSSLKDILEKLHIQIDKSDEKLTGEENTEHHNQLKALSTCFEATITLYQQQFEKLAEIEKTEQEKSEKPKPGHRD